MAVSFPKEQKLFYFYINSVLNPLSDALLLPEGEWFVSVLVEVNWRAKTKVGGLRLGENGAEHACREWGYEVIAHI